MTRLTAWAEPLGYDLDPETLLSPPMIEAYLHTVRFGEVDVEPYLWRLAKVWKTVPAGREDRVAVARPDYRQPYSNDEIDALLLASRNQPTENREATLLAIIAMGAGCGVVREAAKDAALTQLHQHGSEWFFATSRYCAMVLPAYRDLFDEVAVLRPTGLLRGKIGHANATVRAVQWLEGRRGVPELSVDRLRATYVTTLLVSGVSLVNVLSGTGLRHAEALDSYLAYVPGPTSCSATTTTGGAS
jgi:hypothetical protein